MARNRWGGPAMAPEGVVAGAGARRAASSAVLTASSGWESIHR